ncbi:MAG TPA: PhoU domain-containing protein [Egibacteraceae bacterium]|nr:PhoU domain-containing protein [Egibacteraceae bacterium]
MGDEPDPLELLEASSREPVARVDFQAQLAASDRALVRVTRRVASAIEPVTAAFLGADGHGAATAETVDSEVDSRCRELEEACYVLLARQSPVGSDLRRIVAILRATAGVQRSASLLRHVAESLQWVHPPAMSEEVRQTIAQLGEVAADIMGRAADAWERHDGLAAVELERRDDQADLLQKCLLTELYTGRQSVEEAVSLALLARYYERIADHGVEAARQVAYVVTGERVE